MEKPKDVSEPILKQLERIAGEMCDHYCKWPDQYPGTNEDEYMELLAEEHCNTCQLVQFLA